VGLCMEKYRRLRQGAVGSSGGRNRRQIKTWPRCVWEFEDSEIAPCPTQMEAPSFRKTRAFARPKAVLWLDSEYAVENDTKGRMFGAVE
jgi:hypothetical protein